VWWIWGGMWWWMWGGTFRTWPWGWG
jgi:hypothetical protein